MKHFSYVIHDIDTLEDILKSPEICLNKIQSNAVLVQVYYAKKESDTLEDINTKIKLAIPKAIVVGASTIGEIANGYTLTAQTIIGFSFFTTAQIHVTAITGISGTEVKMGYSISETINKIIDPIKAILFLSTTINLNIRHLFDNIHLEQNDITIFGGGAGDYKLTDNSSVFKDGHTYESGCVFVVFTGKSLSVEINSYLGWLPLSKAMTITDATDTIINTIDNQPAFNIYKNYLDVEKEEHFFLNTLEFPLLLERNNQIIARVPVNITPHDGLEFVADIKTGETFRLGYGDPKSIIEHNHKMQQQLRNFGPEAIFLYSCSCRRFLMQDDSDLETLTFEDIAPSFGFYTYGEYAAQSTELELLNSAIVVAAFREGPIATNTNTNTNSIIDDPYANNHTRVVSKLVKFIATVTAELEEKNTELKRLSALEITKQYAYRKELINFINMLGHEIKTPLAVIDSIVQSLELNTEKDQIDTINRHTKIRQAINRLNQLLSEVLINKRFGSEHNLQLILDTWSIYDLIDAMINRYNQSLPDDLDTGVYSVSLCLDNINTKTLNIDCSDYHALVVGDFNLLQVALNNLIENAYKYSPANTDITLKIQRSANDSLCFIVSNKTNDFSIKDKEKIFEKYWRGRESSNIAGAGLGLYLTHKQIEQHSGSIHVELNDKILSFIVKIPIAMNS
ncbi:MAG: FIST C-terminal domain-containing protein [Methylococcales bacterium]|nr:FIST C-terminal domain-containing protein [Methylococcales bacterium]